MIVDVLRVSLMQLSYDQRMRMKARVLVVDDNADVLEILKIKISSLGFEVSLASSAVEALGYLAQGLDPSLIVCDVQMPILSGVEFAQMLRHRRSLIPLFLMSGDITFDKDELDELRVQEFLPKPLNLHLLESKMQDALGLDQGLIQHTGT